ncbi:MAG: serine hydrolase [Gemmatimonadota bacterium]
MRTMAEPSVGRTPWTRWLRRTAGAALLLAGAWPGQHVGAQVLDADSIDAAVERVQTEVGIPGLALAVVRGDSVVHLRGYGVRSVDGGDPVGPNTLFAIGSATKAFTATLAGIMVDEGRLGWDDRVVDRLPGFGLRDPYATAEITIRDLLAHRSGLPTANLMWLPTAHPPDTLIRRLRHLEPAAAFRSAFTYQNVLYLAAGRVLERASDRRWSELLRERILEPLEMRNTNTSTAALTGRTDVATPHVRLAGTTRTVPYRDIDDVAPAGAINSSAEDLARWLRFLLAEGVAPDGRPLVETVTLRETWTPQIVIRADPATRAFHPAARLQAYGLGWFVSDFHGRTLVAHGGGIDGMTALVAWVPEEDLGVAILTNLQTTVPAWIYGILYSILDPALDVGPTDWQSPYREIERMVAELRASEPRRIEGTAPSLPRQAYAGAYVAPALGEARITMDDERLTFRYGALDGTLEHWHHDVFRVEWLDPAWRAVAGPGWVTFRLDRSSGVAGLTLEALPGTEDWMSRVDEETDNPEEAVMDAEQRAAILELPDGLEPIPGDVASPEAVVQAVYECISGPAERDEPRDWDRLRSLFLPNARLVLARWQSPEGDNEEVLRAWDVEEFIEAARGFYLESAFFEREVGRRVDHFGNIAHVFSGYESRVGSPESDPVSRGINSVQLVRSDGRWWIAHLVWDVETPANPLPDTFMEGDR